MKGEEDTLNPSLFDNEENIRQPYRYENGLLEIPTFGWQNNSSVKSDASIVEKSTASSNEVLSHYEDLFRLATNSVKANNRDIFLGIKLKLATLDQLNSKSEFFIQLKELLDALNGEFLTYSEVCDHYNSTYE